jgi:hypothetical protein
VFSCGTPRVRNPCGTALRPPPPGPARAPGPASRRGEHLGATLALEDVPVPVERDADASVAERLGHHLDRGHRAVAPPDGSPSATRSMVYERRGECAEAWVRCSLEGGRVVLEGHGYRHAVGADPPCA